MADNDPAEWRLYSSNLTTQLAVLPFESSHIYLELNAPGTGELSLPLDTPAAASIAVGQFSALYYRGAFRAGFFVDNIKHVDADSGEGGGRMVSISGRGALALLEGSVIWSTAGADTTRTFTAKTKAYILKTLIDEAQARGELATLAYNFTASLDSASVAWTDSEDYSLSVGTSLLDVAQQFAATGEFDFTITLAAGIFTLGAYSAGSGSNLTSTIYFRVGSNCEEVGRDTRSDELYNYYLVKWKDGYATVRDATSISTYGRRTKFLSLEQAQSSASAITYAAAKLALTKDPKTNKTVAVYDGIKPRLFLDYDMADTISLDRFGTVTSDKVLGIQADFDGTEFAHVVIDFNVLMYDNDMRMEADLSRLEDQWNTAHDGDLLEVSRWLSIGTPNGLVNALHSYGGYLYVGGEFTSIGGLAATHIAKYNFSTGTWSLSGTAGIAETVLRITDVAGELYAATPLKVYHFTAGAWALIGTANGSIYTLATDGTNLFVGGSFTLMDAVSTTAVAKWTGATWSNSHSASSSARTLVWFLGDSKLYGAFIGAANVKVYSGGSWSEIFAGTGKDLAVLGATSQLLYFVITTPDRLVSWDGVAGSYTELGAIDLVGVLPFGFSSYLTDIYISVYLDGLSTGLPTKYSGGIFSQLAGGVNANVYDMAVNDTDVYIGGNFTYAGTKNIPYLAVYVTNFQSMVDHLSHDNQFDMAAAIHGATASAVTNSDEFPFWEDTSSALRKITWANIKATLVTYFDTLYTAILTTIPNNGWIAISATWTRTGNHTYTVTGDQTATYRKGAKVRYKDGGSYEYGVIASSVYSSVTTITLLTNTDYAMAAATITDTYISYIQNPDRRKFPAHI